MAESANRKSPISRAPPQSHARRGVLAFAFSLSVLTYLDRVCISAAAPFIRRDLGLSVLQMSFVFSSFTLAYSIFEVPSGWMGDLIGPRKVLTRIVIWWSMFTIATGGAWNYASMLAIRFLFGAGEAGAFPNISHSFARWFPRIERGRANGILFLGSRVGGALAPPLALLLIHSFGWRASFGIFGSIGFIWAVVWYRRYRDDPSEHPGVLAEELAWIRGGDASEKSQAPGKVPWKELLQSSNLYAICGMYFCFGYGLYFYFTWLPTYLIEVLHFSGLAGGLLASLPFLFAGCADVAGGWLTDRLSANHGLRIGRCWLGFAAFLGSGILLFLATHAQARATKAVLIALALGSADLALSACWAVCLDVGQSHAGVVTGFMNTFGNLGGFLGPIIVGYAVQGLKSWELPFFISSAVYCAGALLWLLVRPDRPLVSERTDPPSFGA